MLSQLSESMDILRRSSCCWFFLGFALGVYALIGLMNWTNIRKGKGACEPGTHTVSRGAYIFYI